MKLESSNVSRFPAQNNINSVIGLDTPESIENEELQDGLAEFVGKQFERARTHKANAGIEDRLLRNLAAMKCEYTSTDLALLDGQADIYIGIASLKARAAQSWLRDIVLNNIDKPWTIKSTPVPDLPDVAREQVLDLLMMELQDFKTQADIKDRAKELKTVALAHTNEIAAQAIEKMDAVISDQLAQNNFNPTFTSAVEDITVYPTVFVRGPFESSKRVAQWNGDTFKAEEQIIPDCRVINPFDAYPSPTSKSARDGEFFCEKTSLLPSSLYNAIGVKGFDEVNIRRALADYDEDGYSLELAVDKERERLEQADEGLIEKSGTLDTVIYNGLVPGKYLIEHKVLVEDPQKHYESEIWKVGKYIIKATLNPDVVNVRPIYNSSYVKVNRNIWGMSVIDLVYDTQRVCNAAARSLVKNMAFAAGPFGEVVGERIADGADPRNVEPHKVFLVTPDLTGGGQPVFKFHNIDSVARELMEIFERFMKIADDLSGIPAYVLGNPAVAGAGRTMGGLSMLMGNAAKGIKNVQLNIDNDIISPLIEGFYHYNMQTSKDTAIKADAKVVARGATGLLQRELSQSRLVEILQMLQPFAQNWDQLPAGIKVILREILKQTGLPVDDIIDDPHKQNALLDKARELSQSESFFRGTSDPVDLPTQSQYPGSQSNAAPELNPQPMPLAMPGPA